jgi:nucleotide-binding universal stress UspA family protein
MLIEAARKDLVRIDETPRTATQMEGEGGNIAETVRELALRSRSDLVVVGRGAIKTGLGRLYGHTYDIIRESPCPVLSV